MAMFLLVSGTGLVAHAAASYYDYSVNVPVVSDYESVARTKKTIGSVYNKVSTIGKGSLVSWIENSSGKNISTKNLFN